MRMFTSSSQSRLLFNIFGRGPFYSELDSKEGAGLGGQGGRGAGADKAERGCIYIYIYIYLYR